MTPHLRGPSEALATRALAGPPSRANHPGTQASPVWPPSPTPPLSGARGVRPPHARRSRVYARARRRAPSLASRRRGCLCGARRRGRSWAWRRAALPHPTPPPLSFAGGTSGLEAWGGLALVNKGKPHGRGRALSAGRLAPGALVAVRASGGGPRAPLRPRPVLLPRYVFCGGIAWGSRSCPRPPPLPPPSGSVRAGPWWPGGARRPARGPRAPAARALGGLSAGVPRQCCPEESFLL